MTRTRRLSLLKRLERLEAARQRQANPASREAFVEVGSFDGERHLVMTHSGAGQGWVQERPRPGPQLADFGEFVLILEVTEDEANA